MANQKPVLRSQAPQHRDSAVYLGAEAAVLGRAPGCSLIYQDGTPGVSGRHCAVTWDANMEEFIVKDMNSSYGTFLENGTRLDPSHIYRLRPGSRIWLGDRANVVLLDTELGEIQPVETSQEELPEDIPIAPEPKKKKVLPIILAVILVLAAAAAAVWFFVLRDNGKEGDAAGSAGTATEQTETEGTSGTKSGSGGSGDSSTGSSGSSGSTSTEAAGETKTYQNEKGETITEVYDAAGKLIHKEEPYYVGGVKKGTLCYDAEIKCSASGETYTNETGWTLPVFKPDKTLSGALSYRINLTYYKLSDEELGEQIVYHRTDGVFHSAKGTIDVRELKRAYGMDISYDKPTKVDGFATRSYRSPRSGSFSLTMVLTDVKYVI